MMRDDLHRLAGLRVAHLIECDGPGGAERIIAHLARALQAAGAHNVVFLPRAGEGWLARELTGSGVAIEHFHIDRPLSPACARALTDALRRHRIDVVHSHEFSMAVYGAWACWRAAVPHVITMHGGRYYAGRLRRRIALRTAIAASHHIVAVSDALADAISSDLWMSRSRIKVLPNGVRYAPPELVTLRDELGLSHGDRLLLAVGNLYPVKGHRYLIDAAVQLLKKHPSLHVAIAGRGDCADALRLQARNEGIDGRVHLLGLRPDVAAILAAADIFVQPSLSEGLPLALLEAMWAGRPIVASHVGQIPQALADGDAGILVEPGDGVALAHAIDRLLSDPSGAAEFGARAAQRARDRYGLSQMVGRYAQLYEQAKSKTCHVVDRLVMRQV